MTQGDHLLYPDAFVPPMKQVLLLEHSPCKFDSGYDDEVVIAPNIFDSHFASISVSNCENAATVLNCT